MSVQSAPGDQRSSGGYNSKHADSYTSGSAKSSLYDHSGIFSSVSPKCLPCENADSFQSSGSAKCSLFKERPVEKLTLEELEEMKRSLMADRGLVRHRSASTGSLSSMDGH